MTDGVFLIPIFEQVLVHAPLAGVSALVNRAAARQLARGSDAGIDLDPRRDPPRPRQGPLCPQLLGLIPTRGCNLGCVYCGFGAPGAGGNTMELRTAAALVDWMAEDSRRNGRASLEVHFFGGEPFTAPEVVETAVHRARAAAAENGLALHIEAATNGAYPENRARWIGDYIDTVVLSLDGFPDVHDQRRPHRDGRGSFAEVEATARVLRESPAELCLRLCVGEDNVETLAETAAWLAEEFQPSIIDFEVLQPGPNVPEAGLRPPDPYRFAVGYWKARAEASARGVTASYAPALRVPPRLTFCPFGSDSLIVEPNGRVSACYLPEQDCRSRSLDLTLGRFTLRRGMELDLAAVERARNVVARRSCCDGCFCRWSCAGGCHVNHSYPGCPDQRDDFCLQTRIVTACSVLEDLGADVAVERLVADRPAMERLALRPSDTATALEDDCG